MKISIFDLGPEDRELTLGEVFNLVPLQWHHLVEPYVWREDCFGEVYRLAQSSVEAVGADEEGKLYLSEIVEDWKAAQSN